MTTTLSKLAKRASDAGGSPPPDTPPPSNKTLRNIATRCRHNYQTWTTATTALKAVSEHINHGDDQDAVQVKYGNWYANNVNEYSTWAGAGDVTYYAAIEYPIGTFTLAEWSTQTGVARARSANCPPGTNVVSDPIPVRIPRGGKFKVHVMAVSTSGATIIFPVSASSVAGGSDAVTHWAAAPTVDPAFMCLTGASTGSTSTGSNFMLYPLAILGQSSRPSVMLIGDSRASGRSDSTGTTQALAPNTNLGFWGVGEIARSLDYGVAYTNLGCETDTARQFTLTSTLRKALAADHTHVFVQYGINDVTAGRNAATIQADLAAIYGYFPTKKILVSTIAPKTTSSDSWATATGQTVDAANGVRTAVNDWLRSKPAPIVACFDVADVMETARNSGKWKNVGDGTATAAMTGDGTHEGAFSYNLVKLSNAIDLSVIT